MDLYLLLYLGTYFIGWVVIGWTAYDTGYDKGWWDGYNILRRDLKEDEIGKG